MPTKGYPRNKVRDMEVSERSGAAPRAFETHPNPNSLGKQKDRGTETIERIKLGNIPNKK